MNKTCNLCSYNGGNEEEYNNHLMSACKIRCAETFINKLRTLVSGSQSKGMDFVFNCSFSYLRKNGIDIIGIKAINKMFSLYNRTPTSEALQSIYIVLSTYNKKAPATVDEIISIFDPKLMKYASTIHKVVLSNLILMNNDGSKTASKDCIGYFLYEFRELYCIQRCLDSPIDVAKEAFSYKKFMVH